VVIVRDPQEVLKSLETAPDHVVRYYKRRNIYEVLESLETNPLHSQFSQYAKNEQLRKTALEIERIRRIQRKKSAWVMVSSIAAFSLGMTAVGTPAYAQEIKLDPILQGKPEVVHEVSQDQDNTEIKTFIDLPEDKPKSEDPKISIRIDDSQAEQKDHKPQSDKDDKQKPENTIKQEEDENKKEQPKSVTLTKEQQKDFTSDYKSKSNISDTSNIKSNDNDVEKPMNQAQQAKPKKAKPEIKVAQVQTSSVKETTNIVTKSTDQSAVNSTGSVTTQETKNTAQEAQLYQVQKGDTLWEISKRLYGNGEEWTKIWEVNREKLIQRDLRNASDPGHWIYPGQELHIPTR
jgi:nucleoid-associated protein YgaU